MTRKDLVWIFGIGGEQVGAVRDGLVELWHDERLDQSETFGLRLRADHPKAGLFVEDGEIRFRDRRFRIVEVEDVRDGPETFVSVSGEAIWTELGASDVPGSTFIDTNARAGLAEILSGSRWTVGTRTVSGGDVFAIEETDRSRLALLRVWAKVTGLDLVFDTITLTVDLVETRGRDLGLAYRYRRNVRGHRRRRRPPEATVLLPYGADELTISGVNGGNPEVSDFSFYTDRGVDLDALRPDGRTNRAHFTKRKVWTDSSFVREENLLSAAERKIVELATDQISYELDVVDESDLTGNREDVRVADRVRVADPDFDVDVRVTVVRFFRDFLDSAENKVELSTLPDVLGLGTTSGRTQAGDVWEQFVGPIGADYEIRLDGDYVLGRIPLRFRPEGRANVHVDVELVGVGAGIAYFVVEDGDGTALSRTGQVAYSNGAVSYGRLDFALEDLSGELDLRLVATTTATGGPSASLGINVAKDPDGRASFYVMAQGAVKETPTSSNSITFEYTGAAQAWTVPDNVEEYLVTVEAAQGGGDHPTKGKGGLGGLVEARFAAIPGTDFSVYVGGRTGYPNGGDGATANQVGAPGGGASYLIEAVADTFDVGVVTNALIVAGAGGGAGDGDIFAPGGAGGVGGFLVGGDGSVGLGATQSSPGSGGGGGETGDSDGQGHGGDGLGSAGVHAEGGGGGGGWHGGGGAGIGGSGGSGGGGSGWVDPSGTDLRFVDGSRSGHGRIVISWEDPLPNL